jgi:hypothetical protein
MAKKVPHHLAAKARKCIFCGCPGLSKTHIWPEWLERLLLPGSLRSIELVRPDHISPTHTRFQRVQQTKQGSIFTQKPYLACVDCNTGWMKHFEDEMLKFAKPLFISWEKVILDVHQVHAIATWISLVTVLAEYMDRSQGSVSISEVDRAYLKTCRRPPESWSIFAASLDGKVWRARYRHHSLMVGDFKSLSEYDAAFGEHHPNNTQLSTFGIGNLFFQVFSCPKQTLGYNVQSMAIESGLTQLWPILPDSVANVTDGYIKFPTRRRLSDYDAELLSDESIEIIKITTSYPYVGMHRGV